MKITRRWFFLFALALIGVSSVAAGPFVRNGILQLEARDEGSFPTAATNTIGEMLYGTDAGVPYVSPGDGGVWMPLAIRTVIPSSHLDGYFPGGVLADATAVTQSRFSTAATFNRLTIAIASAGVDGAHNFTADVFDVTTSTVVCVTGAIACNATGVTGVACSASTAPADDVRLRVNDGSCLTTAPTMNIAAEYR